MKWFNAILRYGLIIMVVVAIAVAYVYRHQLFPAFFNSQPVADIEPSAPVTDVETTKSDQRISDAQDQRAEPPSRLEPQESTVYKERPVEMKAPQENSVKPVIKSHQAEEAQSDNLPDRRTLQENQQTPSSMNGPVRRAPPLSPEAATRPSQSPGQADDKVSRTINDQQNEANPQQRYFQLLSSARQSYWQSQYEQAIDSYQQASELQPDNPDIYGEIGNVYYTQGEWKKAGESFYQAAIRLIKHNRPDRAHYLLSVISGLKKERAAKLQQQLDELQQRQYMR